MSAPREVHSGWLTKRGAVRKSWKHRWFVVTADKKMHYYTTEETEESLGTIDLSLVLSISPTDEKGVRSNSFSLTTSDRTWILSAESPQELNEWLHMLEVCVGVAKRLVTSQEGYLQKKGKFNKGWKRRYFALGRGWLFYFHSMDDCTKFKRIAFFSEKVFRLAFFKYVRGSIPLEGAVLKRVPDTTTQLTVSTPHRIFHMDAESTEDLEIWTAAITQASAGEAPQEEEEDGAPQEDGSESKKNDPADPELSRPPSNEFESDSDGDDKPSKSDTADSNADDNADDANDEDDRAPAEEKDDSD